MALGFACILTSAAEAAEAARAGADFLVLSEVLASGELAVLCRLIPVPVYARGLAVEEAMVARGKRD